MRKRHCRYSAVAAAAALLVLGAPGSAGAAANTKECPADYLCVWPHENYAGEVALFAAVPYGSCLEITALTGSAWNRTNITQRLYDGYGCTNDSVELCSSAHAGTWCGAADPQMPMTANSIGG